MDCQYVSVFLYVEEKKKKKKIRGKGEWETHRGGGTGDGAVARRLAHAGPGLVDAIHTKFLEGSMGRSRGGSSQEAENSGGLHCGGEIQAGGVRTAEGRRTTTEGRGRKPYLKRVLSLSLYSLSTIIIVIIIIVIIVIIIIMWGTGTY